MSPSENVYVFALERSYPGFYSVSTPFLSPVHGFSLAAAKGAGVF
jgi:hypothetical protein